jgi:hypothetical protein
MLNILCTLETTNFKPLDTVLHNVLTFIYFLAHLLGTGIVKVLQSILPRVLFPGSIADALGFVIVLTLFVFLVSLSKRLAWIVISICWILLLIRILMVIFRLG